MQLEFSSFCIYITVQSLIIWAHPIFSTKPASFSPHNGEHWLSSYSTVFLPWTLNMWPYILFPVHYSNPRSYPETPWPSSPSPLCFPVYLPNWSLSLLPTPPFPELPVLHSLSNFPLLFNQAGPSSMVGGYQQREGVINTTGKAAPLPPFHVRQSMCTLKLPKEKFIRIFF